MVRKYILKFYRDKYKDIRLKVEKVFNQYINFEGGENEKNVSYFFICILYLFSKRNGANSKIKLIMKIKEI